MPARLTSTNQYHSYGQPIAHLVGTIHNEMMGRVKGQSVRHSEKVGVKLPMNCPLGDTRSFVALQKVRGGWRFSLGYDEEV